MPMNQRSTAELVPRGCGAVPSTAQEKAPTILVPLDDSVQALAALSVARSLAELVHARLHLVHIAESILPLWELLHKLGLTEDDVRGSVVEQAGGDAAASIVRLAREPAYASIVMCSHTGEQAPVGDMGGVAREVLCMATCPIVLVPPAWDQRSWSLRRILVPYDGTPTTAAAIGPALELAGRADAELMVLHVASVGAVPSAEPGAITAPRYVDQAHHEWPAWVHEFLQRACYAVPTERRPPLRLSLAVGESGAEIVRTARDCYAHLIVLGWHGHLENDRALTAKAVIREAPCPILVLRASHAG
jgi:nucleotide-binding universal stress UspA family protein